MTDPVEDAVRQMLGKDKVSPPTPPPMITIATTRPSTKQIIVIAGALAVVAVGAALLWHILTLNSVISSGVSKFASAECPGGKHEITLDGEWKEINPGERCRWLNDFPPNSIEYRDAAGIFTVESFGGHRNSSVARTKSGQPMKGNGTLCPRNPADGAADWDCSPL